MREREGQLQRVTVPDHNANQPTPVTTHEQDVPTPVGRALALALIIGIILGIILVMLFVRRH